MFSHNSSFILKPRRTFNCVSFMLHHKLVNYFETPWKTIKTQLRNRCKFYYNLIKNN